LFEYTLLPDGLVIYNICFFLASATYLILSLTPFDVINIGNIVAISGSSGVEIIQTCSGLAPIGLYSCFVISYPGTNKKRILFLISGILAIILFNIVRLCLLVITEAFWNIHWDNVHSFSSYIFFYPLIFGLWYHWTKINDHQNIVSIQERSVV